MLAKPIRLSESTTQWVLTRLSLPEAASTETQRKFRDLLLRKMLKLKLKSILKVFLQISVWNLIMTRCNLLRSFLTRGIRTTSERSEFLHPSLRSRRVKNNPLLAGIFPKRPPSQVQVVNFLQVLRLKRPKILKNQRLNPNVAQYPTCCNCAT